MGLPGAATHAGSTADLATLGSVLRDAASALAAGDADYLVIGGIACAALGRPRCSSDIDLFVRPECAPRALSLLEAAGFSTERTNPHWIFKAFRDEVLVDVIFKTRGDIYVDDEMLARRVMRKVCGVPVPIASAEDLVVIKALAHDEETPRHWHDALALIASNSLDWEYLLGRARKGPRRVLSLLAYATSVDLTVPPDVIRELTRCAFGTQR